MSDVRVLLDAWTGSGSLECALADIFSVVTDADSVCAGLALTSISRNYDF